MTTFTPAWLGFLLDQFEQRMMQAEFGEASNDLLTANHPGE